MRREVTVMGARNVDMLSLAAPVDSRKYIDEASQNGREQNRGMAEM